MSLHYHTKTPQTNVFSVKLHASHQGQSKTILRVHQCVFWPSITKDIIDMIEKCEVCQKYQDKQLWEQISTLPIPNSPWHTIASDLFEFKGKLYIIVSDQYSKFVIVHDLIDHSAEQTIKAFHNIFCKHDVPKVLITDHGRNYTLPVHPLLSVKNWTSIMY